jgi:archaellum component FlaC
MEFSSIKHKWFNCLDNTLYKMKESKLIKLKNEVKMLTQTVKQLIEDLLKLDSLTRGTLTAFQLHIGEEEWKKVLEELKNIEARTNDTSEKKLDLDDD